MLIASRISVLEAFGYLFTLWQIQFQVSGKACLLSYDLFYAGCLRKKRVS